MISDIVQFSNHTDFCSCCRRSVALSVEFDPTEYAVSEANDSAQLVVKASVPASFDYDVVITTSDLSTTGKNAPLLPLCFVCVYLCVCVCACVRACVCVCEFILSCVFPVTPSPLIILPFS